MSTALRAPILVLLVALLAVAGWGCDDDDPVDTVIPPGIAAESDYRAALAWATGGAVDIGRAVALGEPRVATVRGIRSSVVQFRAGIADLTATPLPPGRLSDTRDRLAARADAFADAWTRVAAAWESGGVDAAGEVARERRTEILETMDALAAALTALEETGVAENDDQVETLLIRLRDARLAMIALMTPGAPAVPGETTGGTGSVPVTPPARP